MTENLEPGSRVLILQNTSRHKFDVGQLVTLTTYDHNGDAKFSDGKQSWWVPSRDYVHDTKTVTYTFDDAKSLLKNAVAAQNAAGGDSNDKEIEYLRGALEQALGLLGIDVPPLGDPFADDEDDNEPTPSHTSYYDPKQTHVGTRQNCLTCPPYLT